MRSNHRPCLWTVLPLLVLIVGVTHALVATTDQDECAGPDLDRAIAACTSLLQNGQVPPRVQVATLHHRGVAYVRNRDHDRALADYDTALQIAPHNPFTHNLRGIAYRLKGEFDRAIADYSHAIELNPTHALAYGGRAFAYRMKLDFSHALTDHDAEVRITPQAPAPYMQRGATYEAMGHYTQALADYRQGFALGAVGDRAVHAIRRVEQRIAEQAPAAPPAPATMPASPPTPARTTAAPAPPGTLGPATVTARPEVRVALVIGNSKYANAPSLTNPQHDAQALADVLRRVGFSQVTLKLDLARDTLVDALKTFATAADRADWAIVYFAGHGLEVGGVNYLVPIDASQAGRGPRCRL